MMLLHAEKMDVVTGPASRKTDQVARVLHLLAKQGKKESRIMSERSYPSARGGPFLHADPAFGLGSASRRLRTRSVPSGTMFKKFFKVN
jgi:hypothetical protein